MVPLQDVEGRIHAWNVALQRQLPYKFSIELAYVANRARGVRISLQWRWTSGCGRRFMGSSYSAPLTYRRR